MFEFIENAAKNIINDLKDNASQMEADAVSYEQQANSNEKSANEKEAEAKSEEEKIHHYKTVTNTITDEDGNTTTETEEIIDAAADAASMARATTLRAQAIKLRAVAAALKALAVSLRATIFAINRQQQAFDQATENAQRAISNINALLKYETNYVEKIISSFNIPQFSNITEWTKKTENNMKKILGLNLSNGLNDELYGGIDYITRLGASTGAKVIKGITSFTCGVVGSIYSNEKVTNDIKQLSEDIINKYFSNTSANLVRDKWVSGMSYLGINAHPTLNLQFDNQDINGIYIGDLNDARKYLYTFVNSGYITKEEVDDAMLKMHILNEEEFKAKYKEISGVESDRYGMVMGFNVIKTHEIYLRNSGDGIAVSTVVHELLHSMGTVSCTPESYNGEKVSGRAFNEAATDIMTILALGDMGDSDKYTGSAYTENALEIGQLRKKIKESNSTEDLMVILKNAYFNKSDEEKKNIRAYINSQTGDEEFFDKMCYNMGYLYESDEEKKNQMKTELEFLIANAL